MLRLTLPQQDFLTKQKLANDITDQLNIETSDIQIHTTEELHFIVGLLLASEYNKVKESTLFEFLMSPASKKLHDLSVKDYVTTRAQLLSKGVIQQGVNDELWFVAIKEQYKLKLPRGDKLSEVAAQLHKFSQVLHNVGELSIERTPAADRLSELLALLNELNPAAATEITPSAAMPRRNKRRQLAVSANGEEEIDLSPEQRRKENNKEASQVSRANIKKIKLATAEILKALGDQASALAERVEVIVSEPVIAPEQPHEAPAIAAIVSDTSDDVREESDVSEKSDAVVEDAIDAAVEEAVGEAVDAAVKRRIRLPAAPSYFSPLSPLPLLDFSLFKSQPSTLDMPLTEEEMEAQLQSWLSLTPGNKK